MFSDTEREPSHWTFHTPEPDAYRDVDGTVFVTHRQRTLQRCSHPDSAATPLWLTETPDPAVIAAVLARCEASWRDSGEADVWRCTCGDVMPSPSRKAHRAHVAAAVCAALGEQS